MSIDKDIKFKRSVYGYDQREVDFAFDAMQEQLDEYKTIIAEYDAKIAQLAENTAQLEHMRAQEQKLLVDVMHEATRFVENIQQESRKKAKAFEMMALQRAREIIDNAKQQAQLTHK